MKLPWSEKKSYAGSAAMFLGGWATAALLVVVLEVRAQALWVRGGPLWSDRSVRTGRFGALWRVWMAFGDVASSLGQIVVRAQAQRA